MDFSMPEETLRYQKKDHVLVIDLNSSLGRPLGQSRRSADLGELCDGVALDEEVYVVVISDTGENAFLGEKGLMRAVSMGRETESKSLAEPISKLDRPVIAAITGDAIGQGLEVALACDIRIASETSCFGMSHIKSGLIPWDGGTQRLSRLVGKSKALEMILTGEVIDAQEALRIGLVHKVVPNKDLTEVTMKMAKEMASKGPIALRYTKEAVYKGMDMTLEQGLRLEADLYLLIHTSKDRSEGIQAFRDKKTPRFEGK
jgi:enoyl-CoA hydratase/carnithine racemase